MKKGIKSGKKRDSGRLATAREVRQLSEKVSPLARASWPGPTPKPMRYTGDVWVSRKLRVFKSVPLNNATVSITYGDVYVAMGGTQCYFKCEAVAAWNVSNSSHSTNYIDVGLSQGNNFYTGVETGPWQDFGAGGMSPAVKVELPFALTTISLASKDGTTELFKVNTQPPGLTTNPDIQSVVIDIWIRVQT